MRAVSRFSAGTVLLVIVMLTASCSSSSNMESAQVERGRAIYNENCQVCHGDPVTGAGKIASAPVHGPEGHTWHHADGQIMEIVFGQLTYPGRTMPSFEGILTEEEFWDVLAYIKRGWLLEQREFQTEVSENWETLR